MDLDELLKGDNVQDHTYNGEDLKYDKSEALDISFGKHFIETQGTTEYKEPENYLSDDRLQRLLDIILEEAIDEDASDIMIKPKVDRGVVFFRLDGKMVAYREVHRGAMEGLVTVVQSRSNIPLGRYKKPDISGHITHYYKGLKYDFRVAGIPSLHGYAVDLRLLSTQGVPEDIGKLGLPPEIVSTYRKSLLLKEGLVIFTGSVRSGKSTSIVAGLNEALKKFDYSKKLVTIENPIEFVIDGALQTSVDTTAGYTEEKALQTFLRFDPDLIMLGEVNDDKTAKALARAASIGNLAFTTIHANNVLEVPDALVHYGVDEKRVFQTLRLVIYQTLQPKICPHCSKVRPITPEEKNWMDRNLLTTEEILIVTEPNYEGCDKCDFGFKGLVILGEMIESNMVYRDIKNEIKLNNGTMDDLKKRLMVTEGINFYPLEKDVVRRLKEGTIGMVTAQSLVGK